MSIFWDLFSPRAISGTPEYLQVLLVSELSLKVLTHLN